MKRVFLSSKSSNEKNEESKDGKRGRGRPPKRHRSFDVSQTARELESNKSEQLLNSNNQSSGTDKTALLNDITCQTGSNESTSTSIVNTVPNEKEVIDHSQVASSPDLFPHLNQEEEDLIEEEFPEEVLDDRAEETVAEELGDKIVGKAIPSYIISTYPAYKQHFFRSFYKFGENIQSYCNLCLPNKKKNENILINVKTKGVVKGSQKSTTNWLRHLRSDIHKTEYEAFQSNSERSSRQSETRDTSIVKTSSPSVLEHFSTITKLGKPRQQELDNSLVEMFCSDNLPINLLRRNGLQNFVKKAAPGYNIPSQDKMRNTLIPKKLLSVKEKVFHKLSESRCCSIILDIWSSKSMEGFLGVSCSGVTKNFEPFTCLLTCRKMMGSHTGHRILSEYEDIVSEWKLSSKVIRVTTDNAANMKKAFSTKLPDWDDEEDELPSEEEICADDFTAAHDCISDVDLEEFFDGSNENDNSEYDEILSEIRATFNDTGLGDTSETEEPSDCSHDLRSSCVAHSLQLVVKDGLDSVADTTRLALKKASKIVKYIRKSTMDSEMLQKNVGFRIPMANATRWNSQLLMLVKLEEALKKDPRLQEKLGAFKKHGSFSALEIKVIREVIKLLKPFQEATDEVQKDSETIGSVIPAFIDLRNKMQEFSKPGGIITHNRDIPLALRRSLETRLSFVLTDSFYLIGACLDPRFKFMWIPTSGMTEVEVRNKVAVELQFLYRKLIQSQNCLDEDENGGAPLQKESVTTSQRPLKRQLFSSVVEQRRSNSTDPAKVVDEFETYIKESVSYFDETEEFRPLNFWKAHSQRFPILSIIAQVVFCVPASSGNIERIFSTATDILSAKRNRMKSDLFENLLFIKRNGHI